MELGTVKQDHENDEDDVQGGHGLSSSSRGQGEAAAGKADTGSTMDAVDSDAKDVMTTEADKDVVDKVDMKAALRITMSRQEIKEDLQNRIKVNYAPMFMAQVAPRILGGLVPLAPGKDPFAPGKE